MTDTIIGFDLSKTKDETALVIRQGSLVVHQSYGLEAEVIATMLQAAEALQAENAALKQQVEGYGDTALLDTFIEATIALYKAQQSPDGKHNGVSHHDLADAAAEARLEWEDSVPAFKQILTEYNERG